MTEMALSQGAADGAAPVRVAVASTGHDYDAKSTADGALVVNTARICDVEARPRA